MKVIFTLALIALLLSSLFYFFSYPGVDNDLWGHLFFGREILQNGKLPLQNLYSYTAPDHPWINHEWLAEVIFYTTFSFFGSPGLILLKLIIGAMIVWILDRVIRERVRFPFARVLTLVWTMAILSPGFNIRPQLFTYFLFTAFLFLFHRYENGKRTVLYWAPLLMLPWVNIHGGFVAGLGAFWLFSFWTVVRRIWDQETTGLFTQVLTPLLIAGIVLVFNPYGLDLLSFLARDLLLNRPITEWQPIPILDLSFPAFKLVVLLVALFSLRSGSLRRWDFILIVVTAILAFRYQRHTPLFAIAAAPFLAEAVQELVGKLKDGKWEWVLVSCIITIALYQFYWISKIHLQHRFQLIVSPREYPTQAVDFLQRNGIRGNLAVPFTWGEYFIWKLYPEIRVSIDGRYTTAYPTEVIQEHWTWMEGKKGWRKLLERYPAEIAITNRYHPVTALLRKDPEWLYIYSDPVAFIFIKKTLGQNPLLERFKEKKLLTPQPPRIYFPG